MRIVVGPGYIENRIGGVSYRVSPNAFFQTNNSAAPILLQTVREFAGDISGKSVLDLYCGTGFFAIALGGACASMVGVELVDDAVIDAQTQSSIILR